MSRAETKEGSSIQRDERELLEEVSVSELD
jgi:hypothetical protein